MSNLFNLDTSILHIYLVVINIIGFIIFYIDKRKAIKHKWRISEKVLFLIALLGGSLGCFVGMYVFHHKTKRYGFIVGIPLIIVIQLGLYYCLFLR